MPFSALIIATETQHGETPAHHRKMGKYDTRRPAPDDHEVASGDARKSRKHQASNKTAVKAASKAKAKATGTAPATSKLADEARGMKHKHMAQGLRSDETIRDSNKKPASGTTPVKEASSAAAATPAPKVSSPQVSLRALASTAVSTPTSMSVQASTPIQGPAAHDVQSTAIVHPMNYTGHAMGHYQGFQPLDYEAAATIQAMKSQATYYNSSYQYGHSHHSHAQNNYPSHGYVQNNHLQNGYTPNLHAQSLYGQSTHAQLEYTPNMYLHNSHNQYQ